MTDERAIRDGERWRHLQPLWLEMGTHERTALLYLAERILMGQRQYGAFNPEKDERSMLAEMVPERADKLVYRAFGEQTEEAILLRVLGRAEKAER